MSARDTNGSALRVESVSVSAKGEDVEAGTTGNGHAAPGAAAQGSCATTSGPSAAGDKAAAGGDAPGDGDANGGGGASGDPGGGAEAPPAPVNQATWGQLIKHFGEAGRASLAVRVRTGQRGHAGLRRLLCCKCAPPPGPRLQASWAGRPLAARRPT